MIILMQVVWDDSGEREARERMRLEMEVNLLMITMMIILLVMTVDDHYTGDDCR